MLDFTSLQVRVLPDMFSVCQLSNTNDIPFEDEYVFVAKTDNEISLVCRTKAVPDSTVNRVDGFRAMRIVGVLELSQVGIVSRISSILTEMSISILPFLLMLFMKLMQKKG